MRYYIEIAFKNCTGRPATLEELFRCHRSALEARPDDQKLLLELENLILDHEDWIPGGTHWQ